MIQSSNARSHFLGSAKTLERSSAELSEKSDAAARAIISSLRAGRKVVSFGNGGSATQASHLAGELIGRFSGDRQALPAIALSADSGSVTCISNDFGYEALFERQVNALAEKGDIVVGLTTSGSSENVLRGLKAARERGAVTVALTGENGLKGVNVDHLLAVPSNITAHIQEVHLMLLHAWCVAIEMEFVKK